MNKQEQEQETWHIQEYGKDHLKEVQYEYYGHECNGYIFYDARTASYGCWLEYDNGSDEDTQTGYSTPEDAETASERTWDDYCSENHSGYEEEDEEYWRDDDADEDYN